MKRHLTIALVSTLIATATPASALAQPIAPSNQFTDLFSLNTPKTNIITIKQPERKPEPPVKAEPPKPEPVVYSVVEGDNLSKIGSSYNVEWSRIWAKNTQLTHPDIIHVGDQLTIPQPDEALSREIPAAVSLPAVTPGVDSSKPLTSPQRAYDSSNTYDYGYCTWYVKNRRGASIPNSLGNANTWYSRAAAMGMAVGYTPRAGAVGTTTRGSLGHVVYVESVNSDGSINISEMNAPVFGQVTYRTASASEFSYIY